MNTLWIYNLPPVVANELFVQLPYGNVRPVQNLGRAIPHMEPLDQVICMWMDDLLYPLVHSLSQSMFPPRDLLTGLFASRQAMTKFVDEHTAFPAEREYLSFDGEYQATVPRLQNSLRVVVKVGEAHRGENKYLLYPGQTISAQGSIVFEEFVEGESVRVLIIGEETFLISYQDDPDNPRPSGRDWVKNINPILVLKVTDEYPDLIADAKRMSQILGYDYIGFDYVIGHERTICLEMNPFPGVSLDKPMLAVRSYWMNKAQSMLNDLNMRDKTLNDMSVVTITEEE